MDVKRCSKCGVDKGVGEFYRNKKAKDGFGYWCKICSQEYGRRNYAKNAERYKAYGRRVNEKHKDKRNAISKRYRAENPEECKEYGKRYREANTEKKAAQHQLNHAIEKGEVVRPDKCSKCHHHKDEAGTIQGHHDDYSKPLGVVWFCQRCHARFHAEQEARTTNTSKD